MQSIIKKDHKHLAIPLFMVKTTANFYDLVTGIGTTQNFASISVSNRQYEERENEKKRTIKILRPELVGDFLKEFDEIIGA
jgi:hypothetical protein